MDWVQKFLQTHTGSTRHLGLSLLVLEERVEDPVAVVEHGVKHSFDEWRDVTVGSRTVEDHFKGVASQAAFDFLMTATPEGCFDEELYTRTVDRFYGQIAKGVGNATRRELRTVTALWPGKGQQLITDFVLTDCSECGGDAQYIPVMDFQFGGLPRTVEEKYRDAETGDVYQCTSCDTYFLENTAEYLSSRR